MVINVQLKRLLAALATLTLIPVGACSQPEATPSAASSAPDTAAAGCISDYDPNANYFPDQVSFDYASGIAVEYRGSYKVVNVREPVQGAAPETYVLVQCGAEPELPADLAGAQRVSIPVKRVVTSSTTQLPAFELLGVADSIVAVTSPEFVSSEAIVKRIRDGEIAGVGTEAGGVNAEAAAAVTPDVFVSSGIADPAFDKLKELNIPVLGNADWLEETPLGRAEWLKFTALLTNTEGRASEAFAQITTDYNAVKTTVDQTEERPSVVAGAPYEGTWSRAGGKSYLAALLADAGMTYVFSDVESTGSEPVEIEAVLEAAADADIWVNADSAKQWTSISAMGAENPNLLAIKAAQEGRVYNPTKRINANGGNDYWEQGVVRPDLVLRDLAKAAHPELFTDQDYTFYEQLPA
ncbi:MAG: ABC transporter substrate-binding protein [Propionibacteriaceae bacterium]|nr:ABC transporter substrate-binding protein [Propionibacteriaceae bacterium]